MLRATVALALFAALLAGCSPAADNSKKKNPGGRWRSFDYEELVKRDKASLDIFWLRDESLEDSDSLPDPDLIAEEIVEDLQAALDQFAAIANDLRNR